MNQQDKSSNTNLLIDTEIPIENSKNNFDENDTIISPFPFFFSFSAEDQFLIQFQKKEICNQYGVEGARSPIPSLSRELECVNKTVEKVKNGLNHDRNLPLLFHPAPHEISKESQLLVNIFINFRELLVKLHGFVEKINEKRLKIKGTVPLKILQIYWIGSSYFSLVEFECIEALASKLYGDKFLEEEWRNLVSLMLHFQPFFHHKGNDLDLRIVLSEDNIDVAGDLSNFILKEVSLKIPQPVSVSFAYFYPDYLNPDFTVEESIILQAGIEKRNNVRMGETRYSIITFKTAGQSSEFNIVGSKKDGQLTLENSSLSSLFGCGMPLLQFLMGSKQPTPEICILENPFGSQFLLDLFFANLTPTTHNLDGWRHFLRKGIRMLDPKHEIKMIVHVREYKKIFLSTVNRDDMRLSREEFFSTAGYLYLVLASYFTKIEEDSQQLEVDPFCVAGFVFRACQSLSTDPAYSDRDFQELWKLVEEYYWNLKGFNKASYTIHFQIKRALVDEKIPYSILSAWIEILIWLCDPCSATTHSGQPVFHSKNPLLCIVPIRPVENLFMLQQYFTDHPLSQSLQSIFRIFIQKHPLPIHNFPLIPCFSSLQINRHDFEKIGRTWMSHSIPELRTLGLHLHFSLFELISDSVSLSFIMHNLPHLLVGASHSTYSKAILQALDEIAAVCAPHYLPLTSRLVDRDMQDLSLIAWLDLLMEIPNVEAMRLAYSVWIENEDQLIEYEEKGWQLFRALSYYDDSLSFHLYTKLQLQHPIKAFPFCIDQLLTFFSGHKSNRLKGKFIDLKIISLLFAPLFQHPRAMLFENFEFRNEDQKLHFSKAFMEMMALFFEDSSYESWGDDYLIEASIRGYLEPLTCQLGWLNRIKQLMALNTREGALSAGALYLLAINRKWIFSPRVVKQEFKQLEMPSNQGVLNAADACGDLFRQKNLKVIPNESMNAIYPHLLDLLRKIPFDLFEKKNVELLQILVLLSSPKKYTRAQYLMIECSRNFISSLSSPTAAQRSCLEQEAFWNTLDRFFSSKKLKAMMRHIPKQSQEEWNLRWKTLLLDYLENTIHFMPEMRSEKLWEIFELIAYSFPKKNTPLLLRLCRQLSLLLPFSSSIPDNTLNWMSKQGDKILHILLVHEELVAAKTILFHLPHVSILHSSSIIWEGCKQEMRKGELSFEMLNLFSNESFELLKMVIQQDESVYLLKLIASAFEHSLDQPTGYAIDKWIEWCFIMHERGGVEQSLLLSLSWKCIEGFIEHKNYEKALLMMSRLGELDHAILSECPELLDIWNNTVEKLLASASNEQIVQLFMQDAVSHFVQKKGESCASIVQKIVVQLMKNNTLVDEDYLFLLDMIECVELKDEGAWNFIWNHLRIEQNKRDRRLVISAYWKVYQSHFINHKKESQFVGCYSDVFSCLEKVAHQDLIDYLEGTEWISSFIAHAPLVKILEVFSSIFLGAIQRILPSFFDADLFGKIIDQKQLLLSKIRKDKALSKQIALWNRKIDETLIKRLQLGEGLPVLKALCQLLELRLYYLTLDQAPDQEFLVGMLFAANQFFELEDNPEEEQGIEESLVRMYQFIGSHQTIPISEVWKFINLILKKNSRMKHYHLALHLFPLILERGTEREISFLKLPFLQMIGNMWNLRLSEPHFNGIKTLEKAAAKLKLSNAERVSFEYQMFKYTFQELLYMNDPLFDEMIDVYVKQAPKLFSNLEYLQEALDMTTDVVRLFADSEISWMLDEKCFESYFFKLLEVRFQVASENSSLPVLKNYFRMVLKSVYHASIEEDMFLNVVHRYGQHSLNLFTQEKRKRFEVIQWIETAAHFFPPLGGTNFGNLRFVELNNPLFRYFYNLKSLVVEGVFAQLYVGHPSKLAAMELWMGSVVMNEYPFGCFTKNEINEIFGIIDRFLSFTPPSSYCILRAQNLLLDLWAKFIPHSQFKADLRPYYLKIFYAMRLYENETHDEETHGSLLRNLIKNVLSFLNKQKKIDDSSFNEINSLFYSYTLACAKRLSTSTCEGAYQVYYLVLCINLFLEDIRKQKMKANPQEWIGRIKELISLVRKTVSIRMIKPIAQLQPQYYSPNHCMRQFLGVFFEFLNLEIANASFENKRNSLLYAWLSALVDTYEEDNHQQLCDYLLVSLIKLSVNTTKAKKCQLDFNDNRHCTLIQKIEAKIETYGSISQKIFLKIILFHPPLFKFIENQLNYYEECSKVISLIPEISGLKTLAYFKAIFATFLEENRMIGARQPIELFEYFLRNIKIHIENRPDSLDEAMKDFIVFFMVRGLEAHWLKKKKGEGIQFIEWIKFSLLGKAMEDPPFRLILLIAELQRTNYGNIQEAMEELIDLMPDLCRYVNQTKRFYCSIRVVELIKKLPVHYMEKLELFHKWLFSFEHVFIPADEYLVMETHCEFLSLICPKDLNYTLYRRELELNSNKALVLRPLSYPSLASSSLEEVFLDCFEELKERSVQLIVEQSPNPEN